MSWCLVMKISHRSNSIVVADKSHWQSELLKAKVIPQIVLLSAWAPGDIDPQFLEPMIRELIELGCRYFVCAGTSSESLHDYVDDLYLDSERSYEDERNNVIMITTWHDADSNEEVANYFLNLTGATGELLAILDDSKEEDRQLKSAILEYIER